MRFEIDGGKPYLIIDGRAYPVKIKGGAVEYDPESGTMTEAKGRYTLREVVAKCGDDVSSIPPRTRKTK